MAYPPRSHSTRKRWRCASIFAEPLLTSPESLGVSHGQPSEIAHCLRCNLGMFRVDRLLISFHCTSVLALPIKDKTPEICCPRLSLSGSPLICILSYRTLGLASRLSGRFFSPLTRFVSGVLNVIIALIDALLMCQTGISHIC